MSLTVAFSLFHFLFLFLSAHSLCKFSFLSEQSNVRVYKSKWEIPGKSCIWRNVKGGQRVQRWWWCAIVRAIFQLRGSCCHGGKGIAAGGRRGRVSWIWHAAYAAKGDPTAFRSTQGCKRDLVLRELKRARATENISSHSFFFHSNIYTESLTLRRTFISFYIFNEKKSNKYIF